MSNMEKFKTDQNIIELQKEVTILKDKVFTIEFLAENRAKRWRWWKFWQ